MFASWAACRATPAEARRTLPGDALIARPVASLTYAITIDAPPARVWPWLAQMGCERAGWYSYDLLDNGGRPSATTITPAWQQVAIGDVLPASPGSREAFVVVDVLAGSMLLLSVPARQVGPTARTPSRASPAASPAVLMTWCFVLEEASAHHTRLLTRARADPTLLSSSSRTPFFAPFATPAELFYRIPYPRPLWRALTTLIHYIMQREQLVQIKQRAERQSQRPARPAARADRLPGHHESPPA